MFKQLKSHRKPILTRTPHKLVSCSHKGGCEYELVWDDGYKTVYSAAVQLGYKEGTAEEGMRLSEDGSRVLFPDDTTMSAELLRVDAMQKHYRSALTVLVFAAGLLAALYWLLYSGAFTGKYMVAMYACVGALCAMTMVPLYRTRCYAVTYIGAALTFIGLAVSCVLPYGLLFVAAGFSVQLCYLLVMTRLTSSGYDS